MFIRTQYDGIGFIVKEYEEEYLVEIYDQSPYLYQKKELSKPSDTIIDLLEVGDYANGKIINKKMKDYYGLPYVCVGQCNEILYEHEIKGVVTEEQFAYIQYKK